MPLTNSLGFEFALINAVIFFLIGGVSTTNFVRGNQLDILQYYHAKWKILLTGIIIPFLIGFTASIILSRCPIKDGLGFYSVITIPSLIFGNLTGAISAILSKRRPLIVFFLIFVLVLFGSLIEFYFNPQVYFYSPIFGFFPGTIYDEDVSLNIRLILSQCYHFIIFIGVFFFLKYWKMKYTSKVSSYLWFCLILLISFFIKPLLGFSTNTWKMNRELTRQVTTPHFVIHFGQKIDRPEQEFISLLHEYYYDIVTSKLNVRVKEKITSYVFDNQGQKRDLFGAGNANVSKPWLNQIYLNHENVESTLKHEIAHAVAAEFGNSIFKVADGLNPAMIEGLAMFVEDDFDGYPVSYAAKLAYNTNHKIDITKLFSGMNFFTSYSSLAYIYSGAFSDFLSKESGIKKIEDVYKDSDWKKIYGEELAALVNRFEKTLSGDSTYFNPKRAQLYFGGQTIFKKYCPRMASNDSKIASDYFRQKNYVKAEQLYRQIYDYSGSYQSLTGQVASLNKMNQYSSAAKVLESQLPKFFKNQFFYNLELILADTYVLKLDETYANGFYDSLLTQKPHIVFTNEVKIRKLILSSMGLDSLKAYLLHGEKGKFELLKNLFESSFQPYLIPRILNLSVSLRMDLADLTEKFKRELIVKNYETSYIAMEISKYYMRRQEFNNARIFAVKSLDFRQNYFDSFAMIENLRMANWFINLATEMKERFSYSDDLNRTNKKL